MSFFYIVKLLKLVWTQSTRTVSAPCTCIPLASVQLEVGDLGVYYPELAVFKKMKFSNAFDFVIQKIKGIKRNY